MAVPALGHAGRLVALVGELQAPDPIHLDRGDAQLGLRIPGLQRLQQGDAVDDQRARNVDRVDAPTLARAIDPGRA